MNSDKKIILIVDDERFNLNVLKDLLEPDYDILVAKNGVQALQRATGAPPPDLILLDIMMPDMDGHEVLRQLKAGESTREIPVIFVTAMGEVQDEARGLALGAVDYIIKPISPPILRARVRTHLALKQSLVDQKRWNGELSQLNEELTRKKDELLALIRLKNQFLGMASHDLRNPLAAIRGMSELLLMEAGDAADRQQMLTSIRRISDQALGLLGDLLDVSALESGQLHWQFEENDLWAVLRERFDLLEPTGRAKQIRLELDDSTDLPLLRFDRMRLEQVVDNLLSNAIKFSPSGSVVRLRTLRQETQAGFWVADQGPGIPTEEQGLLFQPFQKLSPLPTGGEKSTGMGLFIVKKIIDAHGGTIQVEANPDGGSRFVVQLPMNAR